MSLRSSFRLRVPISCWWALVLILAFLGLAYGRPFTWAVLLRQPAVVTALCGPDARADLVLRSELRPLPEGPYARAHIAEYFACRDPDGSITTDKAFHDKVVWAGAAALSLVLFAVSMAVRFVWRLLFRPSYRPNGEQSPAPAARLWAAIPAAGQWRVQAATFAAGVGLAVSILPTALTLQNLHRIPGAAALICESGRLDPYGYAIPRAFSGSRPGRQIACLDDTGEPIVDERRNERVAKSVLGVSWLALGLLFYPIGVALFRDGRRRR